jgi:hypothetical protein
MYPPSPRRQASLKAFSFHSGRAASRVASPQRGYCPGSLPTLISIAEK